MKKLFVLPLLVIGLGSGLPLTAQTFKTLHDFPQWDGPLGGPYINSDGGKPEVALIMSGDTLYGTTAFAGSSGNGTLFALNTDGTGFTVLYNFGDTDGAGAYGSLILSGHIFYGTRTAGGSSGSGTVFAVNTDGTGFTTLYAFTGGDDGAKPGVGLVLLSNVLFGTTSAGGSSGSGTVFAINTNGTGFRNLYVFTGGDDGANPLAGLVSSGNTLYGTANQGGNGANGTVFKVNGDGTGFTTLHNFTSGVRNSDGRYPTGLTLSGNVLYGMAESGGSSGFGTVFSVNTDGTGFQTLYNFRGGSDGENPSVTPILSGSTLYGVTPYGSGQNGTVFSISTNGTGFKVLHSFTATPSAPYTNWDGAYPSAALIVAGNNLYGPAASGGGANKGTLFSIALGPINQPQLAILPDVLTGTNVVLSWPTNATGFTLQSTTNLASPVWTTNSLAPIVVNGQNTVTNPISGTQQFFRLSQ